MSDKPIPVFTNRSDTDTFHTEVVDTDLILILGAYHYLPEIHSMLHLNYKAFGIKIFETHFLLIDVLNYAIMAIFMIILKFYAF